VLNLTYPLLLGPDARPITRGSLSHISDKQQAAVDIAAERWDELVVPHDSSTTFQPNAGECGNRVQFDFDCDPGHITLFYCHLQDFAVYGGWHAAGTIVGYAGDSGLDISTVPGAGGVHCHMAGTLNGQRLWLETLLRPAPQGVDVDKVLGGLDRIWEVKGLCEGGKPFTKVRRAKAANDILVGVIAVKEGVGVQ